MNDHWHEVADVLKGAQSDATALPADDVLDRMTRFVAQHLAKPLDPSQPDSQIAIAETAEPFNDTAWFWVDDSGKSAELFAVPRVRDAYPELADAMLDYVLRLSSERIIQRRSALPQLKLRLASPEAFHAYNAFFHLTGDLTAGVVRPAIRFNDDRTRFVADYGGNVLRFRFGGRPQAADVESAVARYAIETHPDRIIFSHTSAIEGRTLLGRRRHVCDLTYRYSLWKARPEIRLEAEITTMPGITLHDVKLSTAIDQLLNGGAFDTVRVSVASTCRTVTRSELATTTLHEGPADYLGICETRFSPRSESAGIPGFAHGIHIRFRNGKDLGDIRTEGSEHGCFNWIYPRYAFGRIGPQESRSIVEDRLLTGGGYYGEPDIYCRILDGTKTATDNIDPSMSYDIGAELNAVAITLLLAKEGRYRHAPSSQRLAGLKSWYDRHLRIYLDATRPESPDAQAHVFIRGLSFIILSLDCMARAFTAENYGKTLGVLTDLLLRTESRVDGAPDESLFSGQLDCHCSALLALARAAFHLPEKPELQSALRRALRGTIAGPVHGELFGRNGETFDSIFIRPRAGARAEDAGFWVFKLGLALRAFNAIRQGHDAGFVMLDGDTLAHLDTLAKASHRALLKAIRRNDGTIEVLTSAHAGETNSETQPWCALGLVPAIEWELFGRPDDTAVSFVAGFEPPPAIAVPRFVEFDRMSPPIHVEWECPDDDAARLIARTAVVWSRLGETKPHWSVMSNDEYQPSRIAENEELFYASGKGDCDRLLATIARVGRDPAEFNTVLEYGCGLGRVTNHLAKSFRHVLARDISEPHLALARSASVKRGRANIDYGIATLPDLGMSEPFDIWFSFIVLQHNPPPVAAMILRRAVSMLRESGLAVFQVPTYGADYRFSVKEYLTTPAPTDLFEMHCLPQAAVFRIAGEAGCDVLEVVEDHVIGNPAWLSNTVVLAKRRRR